MQLREGDSKFIDFRAIVEAEEPPTLVLSYEYRDNDFVEALITKDELVEFFNEFEEDGKSMQR